MRNNEISSVTGFIGTFFYFLRKLRKKISCQAAISVISSRGIVAEIMEDQERLKKLFPGEELLPYYSKILLIGCRIP